MDVSPGEIIHMDENGACKFPENRLEQVLKNVRMLSDHEKKGLKHSRKQAHLMS